MSKYDVFSKFPAGSSSLDYDIFEKFPDGSAAWRGCVIGMASVELKMRELARGSANKFFARSSLYRDDVFIPPHSLKQTSIGRVKRTA
jgi:hypothetical protein